ncbi:MAG TPA: beta-propeller domain-containing protein, partial [Polyangiales bacterium]|nr:beta-propeller domain-containing protein [Polyangiales bacterium]
MPRPSLTGSILILAAVVGACDGGGAKKSAASGEQPNEPAAGQGAAPAEDEDDDAAGSVGPGAAGRKSAAAGSGAAGRAADSSKGGDEPAKEKPPLTGATDFSSADVNSGRAANGAARGAAGSASDSATAPAAMSPMGAQGASARTVERGDIYRVLADGRILNLNAYRGLQVIDVRDVNAPRIEGRLAVSGTPLEMYVTGDRAIVLLNEWRGYYASGEDVNVEGVQSGIVLNVDIRDRAAPKLLSQAVLNGNIRTSRLTQGDGQSALYVASSTYTGLASTLIKSFDVSGDGVTPKSEIDLGGYVQDVQATTNLMLVSSIDYSKTQQGSQVALIDISRPDGTMLRGGSVQARGVVENKFNMDAYNGVLRVVSGASWSGTRENHLETFSLANLAQPRALAHCSFGAGESLFATVFVENNGFFVTYLRQDPFHAFSIDNQGRCEEHTQYVVSGWNDFLRPTLGGTRLIGVGSNDANQRRTVSVSLYDTTNIDNPRPMLARADLTLDSSYSEAQWDDRAFSVLEDAVDVAAADGTRETGLVLVPFQGYDANKQQYIAQVQILTFSQRTLTRRGVMDHGSAVRRTFLASESTAANLSDEELRLFDIGDPGKPDARGKVEVAPSYRQVFVFGDHVARLHDRGFYFGWNGNPNVTPPAATLEIVPRSADPDTAAPIASIAVPSNGSLTQVGKLLVSVVTLPISGATQKPDQPQYRTQIQVYDLSDPTQPKQAGSLETDRIQPYYYGPFILDGARGVIADCFDCYPRPRVGSTQYVVGEALVFVAPKTQQKSNGIVHRCYEYPTGNPGCTRGATCSVYYSGGKTCATYKDGHEECSGEFYECDGNTCTITDKAVPTTKNCTDQEEFRYWTSYAFDPL